MHLIKFGSAVFLPIFLFLFIKMFICFCAATSFVHHLLRKDVKLTKISVFMPKGSCNTKKNTN